MPISRGWEGGRTLSHDGLSTLELFEAPGLQTNPGSKEPRSAKPGLLPPTNLGSKEPGSISGGAKLRVLRHCFNDPLPNGLLNIATELMAKFENF